MKRQIKILLSDNRSGEKPDFGFFACGQTWICVSPSIPFHLPAFKEGKTEPGTQVNTNGKDQFSQLPIVFKNKNFCTLKLPFDV